MFGISGEHLLVLLVILIIFGPKRLPDLGHSIGKTMKNFKDALAGQTEAPRAPITPASQIEKTELAESKKEEKKEETPVS